MKNNRRIQKITSEDFDSLNMRESLSETHQTRNTRYFLSESSFDCRFLRDFDPFYRSRRHIFRKLKK